MDFKSISALEQTKYDREHWEGSFNNYIDLCKENPKLYRNAFQRMFDMILSHGTNEYTHFKERVIHYNFFDDPMEDGLDAVYGIDPHLMKLVKLVESAANSYGTESRIFLLHGPVGSSKSTIARLMKKGLQEYSKKDDGAVYSFKWILDDENKTEVVCPMHEDPLHLIPLEHRETFGFGKSLGNLCPLCRFYFNELMTKYSGDVEKIYDNHIKVFKYVFSEDDRIGIATFQPKDEKNQDSTELTGDIDYRKIAEYGRDSDPRAFNFDGEFCVANRGMIEMIEVLKLDVAFLYDLLTASQEHKIKPKKFSHVDIDEVILGHCNASDFVNLQKNESMEALRDRTVRVDIPYIKILDSEMKIYEKRFKNMKDPHIAPHTLEVAAMWSVLTRLRDPEGGKLSIVQKMKLYNGKTLPGFTEDHVKEMMQAESREGMEGISPRYIQDKISNAIVNSEFKCINPFMVMNELDKGLDIYSLTSSPETRKKFRALLNDVKEEYEYIVKREVQRAIAADDQGLARICQNYIDNIKAFTSKEKVKNKYTGKDEEPDERLMRAIEEKIDIPDERKGDFRLAIMNYIGGLAVDGKKFDYKSNPRLQMALELKLFEDQKDTIKLNQLVTGVVDSDTQAKIDIVKGRLISEYGYCDNCATDSLNFVSSIMSRSNPKVTS